MKHKGATYTTVVRGFGKHAALEIPQEILTRIGGNKRAPLRITINRHTYQSTATGVDGKCMVVFPMRDRVAAGVDAGKRAKVTLELDSGYRKVDMPVELTKVLRVKGLDKVFRDLPYSKRREYARQVSEAKAEETRERRIAKIIASLSIGKRNP